MADENTHHNHPAFNSPADVPGNFTIVNSDGVSDNGKKRYKIKYKERIKTRERTRKRNPRSIKHNVLRFVRFALLIAAAFALFYVVFTTLGVQTTKTREVIKKVIIKEN